MKVTLHMCINSQNELKFDYKKLRYFVHNRFADVLTANMKSYGSLSASEFAKWQFIESSEDRYEDA